MTIEDKDTWFIVDTIMIRRARRSFRQHANVPGTFFQSCVPATLVLMLGLSTPFGNNRRLLPLLFLPPHANPKVRRALINIHGQ